MMYHVIWLDVISKELYVNLFEENDFSHKYLDIR